VRTGSLPPLPDARTFGAAALATAAATITAAPSDQTATARTPVGRAGAAARTGRPAPRRRGPLIAAVAVLVLAAASGGTWLALRGGGDLTASPDTLANLGVQPPDARPEAQPGTPGAPLPTVPVAPATSDTAKAGGRAEGGGPAAGAPPVQPQSTLAEGRRQAAPPRTGARREQVPAEQRPAPAPAPAAIAHEGTGLLRVRTVPPTAQIFVAGRRVGDDGYAYDVEVPAGAQRLRINAPGYVTFDTTITIEPGITLNLGTKTLRSVGGP
jgi:hypothetical protein